MSKSDIGPFMLGLLCGAGAMACWGWWQCRQVLRELRRALRASRGPAIVNSQSPIAERIAKKGAR
jgi:hypothetical protein